MRVLHLSWAVTAAAVSALLLGCVAKPPESPIVLRHPSPEHRQARTAISRHQAAPASKEPPAASADAPVAAEALPPPTGAPLSPAAKEDLFRDFDDYLAKSGHAP